MLRWKNERQIRPCQKPAEEKEISRSGVSPDIQTAPLAVSSLSASYTRTDRTINMSLLSVVEDRPTPRQVYNWRIFVLAAIASSASCMIGYDSSFIGQTVELTSFRDEFHFGDWSDAKQDLVTANIVSLYQAGAFFGALFAYPIGFYLGRRWGLLITGIIFVLGSGLMLGASGDRGLGLMYAGRVLAGIGVGAGSNLTPIYISELSPPAIRGRLVGIYELGWQVGGLVGFWINVCFL